MSELTPREIVNELDRYIIGQHDAKRAVAIARKAMKIAGDICIYTNHNVLLEKL